MCKRLLAEAIAFYRETLLFRKFACIALKALENFYPSNRSLTFSRFILAAMAVNLILFRAVYLAVDLVKFNHSPFVYRKFF